MTDEIDELIEQLQEIKDDSEKSTGGTGTCDHDRTRKVTVEDSGANRTASRLVGGVNMKIVKKCKDCGRVLDS